MVVITVAPQQKVAAFKSTFWLNRLGCLWITCTPDTRVSSHSPKTYGCRVGSNDDCKLLMSVNVSANDCQSFLVCCVKAGNQSVVYATSHPMAAATGSRTPNKLELDIIIIHLKLYFRI